MSCVFVANIWQTRQKIWAFKRIIREQQPYSQKFGKYFGSCYTYGQSVGNGQVANICPNALFP